MRVAAVNWKIREISHQEEFVAHAVELIDDARAQGAELVVLPECFTLELLHLAPPYEDSDVPGLIPETVLDPIADFCRVHQIHLVAGSTFVLLEDRFLNVSRAFWADGRQADQAKLVMTQFEAKDWKVSAGAGVQRLPDPRFGISICYDSEFPEGGRAIAESGVLCQCVPAFTETEHGFHRVRFSCHARAIENQIYVVHSSLIGSLGKEPVPEAVGSSAILAPSVPPFPANGVLAETAWNEEGVAVAELDFDVLLKSRNEGDVRNWDDRHRGDWRVLESGG